MFLPFSTLGALWASPVRPPVMASMAVLVPLRLSLPPMMPVIALAPPMIPVWIMPLAILSMSVVSSYPKERRMVYKFI
ncbi:hypothetical protein H3R31_08825 [Commensalibacter sp. M0266]|uniref:hypothetical protein n=1 Tax=unclassified Commensalibacter TaxID=2630218 RepID=UPI0018DC4A99|nr:MULTISPECIES: hypothetical protein [unclassified Commensalibacter]MBH9978060.1 hypothetical protein [Commensalibacter sp. M0266]MBI0047236.1 hypothetical protein [Commensalibacter sp. M0267]